MHPQIVIALEANSELHCSIYFTHFTATLITRPLDLVSVCVLCVLMNIYFN